MKRVLLTIAVALLIPSILAAAPVTVGLYYEGGLTVTPPGPFINFEVGLYIVQSEYDITAIEYNLEITDAVGTVLDPAAGPLRYDQVSKVLPPKAQAEIGNPFDPTQGHSITYWPPMNGFPNGYDLMCTYEFYLFATDCSQIYNYHIDVVPNPGSGYLRATYLPDAETVDLVPLTLWVCPDGIGVEEQSWGAIKSMYN
jgi:hypothetical protein